MSVQDERLLCLHSEDGRELVVAFSVHEPNYDPPVGSTDSIQGQRYRVIRGAEPEPFPDGKRYWAVHAIMLVDPARCH